MQRGDIVRYTRADSVSGGHIGPGLHYGDVGIVSEPPNDTGYTWVIFPLINEYFLPKLFLEPTGERVDGD